MDTIVAPKKNSQLLYKFIVASLLLAIIVGIPIVLFVFRSSSQAPTIQNHTAFPTRSTFVTDQFAEDEFVRGWYWGPEKSVPGKPPNWVVTKVGDKYCWHMPNFMCKE